MPVVNSHDGWSPLEEIIVGTPFHLDYSDDVSFRLFFHNNLYREPDYSNEGHWVTFLGEQPNNEMRDELLEDLVGFIGLLESEGVRVRRPEAVEEAVEVKTPDWSAPLGHALMTRDLFIVIGNEILESAPMVRSRYFERNLYMELFTEYFNAGAKWTLAPRSRLQTRNWDYSYAQSLGYSEPVPDDPFFEIMFDAPQIMRVGRDLIFNCSTENHRMGRRWLQRHLGPEYHVHEVFITDHHIDGLIIPLRPGVLLVHQGVDLSVLPAALQKWDVIWYEPLADAPDVDHRGHPLLASQSIGMNVLSLDEQRVVVQDSQLPLIRDLERKGFTPLSCRWRHGRTLGGGFHCMTLDIRRRGELADLLDTGPGHE